MRFLNVLLALVVSLVIGLLVFEGGLRVLGFGPPNTLNRFDPAAGWSKKPNHTVVRSKDEFTVTFRTNAAGLRDDPVQSPKPAGTFRVLMLGDSFTLGYTVDREDLFVDLLERRWRAEGRPVDVLNCGTEGWSTDQEVAWLMEHGRELQPDLVVLLPYDNDVFWCGQPAYTSFQKPLFKADGTLETGQLPDTTRGWRQRSALGRLLSGSPSIPTFSPVPGVALPGDFSILLTDPPSVLGDAPARAKGALAALKSHCAALGAELVVAPIPSNASADPAFAQLFGERVLRLSPSAWSPDRALEFFLATCRDLGIATVDARQHMRAAHAREACYFDFFRRDKEWHFNPAGNLAFAEFLAGALDARLPAKVNDAPAALAAATHHPPAKAGVPGFLIVYGILWVALTALYFVHYRDEPAWLPPVKVGVILAAVFTIFLGVDAGVSWLAARDPRLARWALGLVVAGILGFVAWKLGSRLATIAELLKAFVLRGHWYLMPLVVVLLSIGSLLVVAASSPFVAPFIYTLF